ncbi:DNA mismatch repair protein msh2 [Zancudomyces culisetae]|uniref:DNA mismatch repair protein msh2 n=1 Tax=Zancudomyces culisetae TaxID=1213189 RepID=A0A1R1PR94_ZANCU|nr:DNA mismatch repair protein msh2 [Zancudomyces culisetae]|eukprot:OMH83402.1 DNA mismatch repair protein msh2 [Zancudomyces culisetae]
MDQTLQKMHSEQEQTSMDLGMEMDKKLKLEQSPTYGYCFRLSRNDASCLRNKQSKYHELMSGTWTCRHHTTERKAVWLRR